MRRENPREGVTRRNGGWQERRKKKKSKNKAGRKKEGKEEKVREKEGNREEQEKKYNILRVKIMVSKRSLLKATSYYIKFWKTKDRINL